jgi:osmotically-inducible protein OsmY
MPDDNARQRDRMRSERDDRYGDDGVSGRGFGGREGGRHEGDDDRTVHRYRVGSHDDGATGHGRSGDYGDRFGSQRNYDHGSGQGEDRSRGIDQFRRSEDHGRGEPGRGRSGGGRGDERGFFERAGDEMATWFGSEDAGRRRERDASQGDEGARHHRGRGPSGYRRSDTRITEDINDRLTEDAYIDASEVQVRVENGEVTLDGTVDDRRAKRRAEDIAEAISGVTHVQNNLRARRPGGMLGGGHTATGGSSGGYTGTAGSAGTLGAAGLAGTGAATETDAFTGSTTGARGAGETTGSGGTMGTRPSSG